MQHGRRLIIPGIIRGLARVAAAAFRIAPGAGGGGEDRSYNLLRASKKGQSLVEMAISVPILLFMLIGVFEVGWALRGYLVLVNVNREITRYSVRPGYLDFSTRADIEASYAAVRDWATVALSDQLDLDFDDNTGNATIIISHVVVNTGKPCENTKTDAACAQCTDFNRDDPTYNPFPLDDLVIHPEMDGQEFQQERFGPATGVGGDRESRIDFSELVMNSLVPDNNRFNCEIIKRDGIPSDNNVIVTEIFYDQPQLFGFPVVSNPYTDPVPLYSHTVMRLVSAARGDLTANIDTIGPVCVVHPFIVEDTTVAGLPAGAPIDILDGPGGSDKGFLAWASLNATDVDDLNNELLYPQLSLTQNGGVALRPGGTVKSFTTNVSSDTVVKANIENLVGKEIVIPVWDQLSGGSYRIKNFITVRITGGGGVDLANNEVMATYGGLAGENCNPPDES